MWYVCNANLLNAIQLWIECTTANYCSLFTAFALCARKHFHCLLYVCWLLTADAHECGVSIMTLFGTWLNESTLSYTQQIHKTLLKNFYEPISAEHNAVDVFLLLFCIEWAITHKCTAIEMIHHNLHEPTMAESRQQRPQLNHALHTRARTVHKSTQTEIELFDCESLIHTQSESDLAERQRRIVFVVNIILLFWHEVSRKTPNKSLYVRLP